MARTVAVICFDWATADFDGSAFLSTACSAGKSGSPQSARFASGQLCPVWVCSSALGWHFCGWLGQFGAVAPSRYYRTRLESFVGGDPSNADDWLYCGAI